MYRMLRIQKRMTVDDMVESVEGVSRAYVLEFFQWLAREGWVRKIPTRNNAGIYVLIKNELEMPVNDQKAAKLRELRRKKKAALSGKLDEIDSAVKSARNILKSLEDE